MGILCKFTVYYSGEITKFHSIPRKVIYEICVEKTTFHRFSFFSDFSSTRFKKCDMTKEILKFYKVSKLLVDNGADIKETDFDQKNLLHWAVESLGREELEELLSFFKEEDVLDLINDRDNFGNAPAHLAARNGSLEILQVSGSVFTCLSQRTRY